MEPSQTSIQVGKREFNNVSKKIKAFSLMYHQTPLGYWRGKITVVVHLKFVYRFHFCPSISELGITKFYNLLMKVGYTFNSQYNNAMNRIISLHQFHSVIVISPAFMIFWSNFHPENCNHTITKRSNWKQMTGIDRAQ